MSVKAVSRELIMLTGECPSEEAETLLQRLLAAPSATVDLRECRRLHTAVIQVLLAAGPTLRLPPDGEEQGMGLRAQLAAVITR